MRSIEAVFKKFCQEVFASEDYDEKTCSLIPLLCKKKISACALLENQWWSKEGCFGLNGLIFSSEMRLKPFGRLDTFTDWLMHSGLERPFKRILCIPGERTGYLF